MAIKDLPTPEMLRKLLAYDADTGKLTWLPRARDMFSTQRSFSTWNARFAGKEAFTATRCGYRHGAIFNRLMQAHRVAWAIYYGEWPNMIDHINGVRDDNRIANMRDVDDQENRRNQARPNTNTSGVVGVCWNAHLGIWQSQIRVERKQKHLGYFTDFDDACAARKVAEIEHGFHPNHGRAA